MTRYLAIFFEIHMVDGAWFSRRTLIGSEAFSLRNAQEAASYGRSLHDSEQTRLWFVALLA
jgi:hypothetical protein